MNPLVLETLKVLAGISNAERMQPETRLAADKIALELLRHLSLEVQDYTKANSPIMR